MGFPGSGKSTFAKNIPGNNKILSSDSYFTDSEGNYNWTFEDSHKGHEDCLRKFIRVIVSNQITQKDPFDNIIIDNTNLKIQDISVYLRIAQAYEYEIEVKYIKTDLEVAKVRNIHRVPAVAYDGMQKNFELLLQIWPKDFPAVEYV